MWTSLRPIVSHVPSPELRSGWAEKKKISPISTSGGARRAATPRRMPSMLAGGYRGGAMTVDVWMQHPTPRFLRHDMFESLRRWTGQAIPEGEIPVAATVAAMDAGGVRFGLLSAWHGPEGPLIANDEVAGVVEAQPDRFAALAAVDLRDPVGAVRELRRCVRE